MEQPSNTPQQAALPDHAKKWIAQRATNLTTAALLKAQYRFGEGSITATVESCVKQAVREYKAAFDVALAHVKEAQKKAAHE